MFGSKSPAEYAKVAEKKEEASKDDDKKDKKKKKSNDEEEDEKPSSSASAGPRSGGDGCKRALAAGPTDPARPFAHRLRHGLRDRRARHHGQLPPLSP
jgi:hypothetical protein